VKENARIARVRLFRIDEEAKPRKTSQNGSAPKRSRSKQK
jgi:hypothetical protein